MWIWGEPINLESTTKTILIDTEGLFSLNWDEKFDTTLFLFSMLISSVLIYNTFGSIEESAIHKLAFVGDLADKLSKI